MMFRSPGGRALPAGHVVHGPFPARWPLIGVSAAALFVGLILIFVALMSERLVCNETTCHVEKRYVFARSELRGAHVVIQTGSKNSKTGIVTLDLERGRAITLMGVEPDQARGAADSIQASVRDGTPIDVRVHGPTGVSLIGAAGIILSFVFLGLALAKLGRYDLIVTPDGARLDVKRSIFGIPFGTREIMLDRIERVVVRRGVIKPVMQGRNDPLIDAARLELVSRSGEERPITNAYFPGHALHLRAAAALRAALLVDADPNDDAELAAIPMRSTAMGQRIGFAWAGMTTGSVVGLAIFGLSMNAFGVISLRQNIEGWMVAAGCIPGAIGGVAVIFHATRRRYPR